MKKYSFIILTLILLNFLIVPIISSADSELKVSTQNEYINQHYESTVSNLSRNVDNYNNLTAYNGSINWVDFPYGNVKPYLEREDSIDTYHNYTIKNVDNHKALEIIDAKDDNYYPSLSFTEYTTSNNNLNFSCVFKYNLLLSNLLIFYFSNSTGDVCYWKIYYNNLGTDDMYIYLTLITNDFEAPTEFRMINKDIPITFIISIDILNNVYRAKLIQNEVILNEHIKSASPYYTLTNIDEYMVLVADYATSFSNFTFYSFDSNRYLKYNSDVTDWHAEDYTDPYYTDSRILETYNVNDESYETFDYDTTIADKVNYQYNSTNCSIGYEQRPFQQKDQRSDRILRKKGLCNSLAITFSQYYSEFNITDSFEIVNDVNFEKVICADVSYGYYTIQITNDTNWVNMYYYPNGTVHLQYDISNSLIPIGKNGSFYVLREMMFGLGNIDMGGGYGGFYTCRNNTEYMRCGWMDNDDEYWSANLSASTWKFRILNYNFAGSSLGTFYVKGIQINDYTWDLHSLSAELRNFPKLHQNLTEYSTEYTYNCNYPIVGGYQTYQHYIAYIDTTLTIDTVNEYTILTVLETENQTNYFSANNESQRLYGYYLFYYLTVDNYTVDITDIIQCYGNMPLEFNYQFYFKIVWYYYQVETEQQLLDVIFDMLVPIGLLILFPYAFSLRFGKKGAVVGLGMGIIVLGVGGLLSFTYSIILVVICAAIGVLVFKSKEKGESEFD